MRKIKFLWAALLAAHAFIHTGSAFSQSEPIDLSKLSEEEIYALLSPEKQEEVRKVVADARKQSQEIVANFKKEIDATLKKTTDDLRKQQIVRIAERLEKENEQLLREIEAELRKHLFVVNLYPDTVTTGALAFSSGDSLCRMKGNNDYQLLQAICEVARPPGMPAEMPRIMDPIIVWHCNMPRAFAPEPVREICDNSGMAGQAYLNPRSNQSYAVLEQLFENDQQRRLKEQEDRKAKIAEVKASREDKQACGEALRQAEIFGMIDIRSEEDLAQVTGIKGAKAKRAIACRKRYGDTDPELYKLSSLVMSGGRGYNKKEKFENYCSMYNRAFPTYRKQIQSWNFSRKHREAPLRPSLQSVVDTIIKCNKVAARESKLAPHNFK